ncbi:uncharacterized protein F4822DRAFT_438664 [Hypoxylon trugodes]|uniref:uncharacterized protein n=1 Tax=Hypoxylon trugodes TaxID=326681 RepID=UPI00219F589A|nr:uncharacterized protein F4822DRAFT_438664 [Hypoxylon trugodes]KAI1383848.1 hypothetical protein F4822DRAFT_438664 [Hypoxylon trugodes]
MDLLQSVFNHLVLPPKVPGSQDSDIESISRDVLMRMIRTCKSMGSIVDSPWLEAFQSLQASMETCLALHLGRLEVSTLRRHLRNLESDHILILHVVEQNSALLIHRETCDDEDRVVFEAFETSAPSERVLAAGHALQWDFPGRCAQIPFAKFIDEPFQECLSAFLEQASMESIYSLQAAARKASISVTEVRDTTDPALITQMLMPLLEANGSHFQPPVLRKKVRDEVNIRSADLPWRRLPFWLVLRVAAQRQLCQTLGNEQGRIGYKVLICLLLSELLRESTGKLGPDQVITLRAKLCRRMAKLEMDRTMVQQIQPNVYTSLFDQICPRIETIIREATTQLETAWEYYKQSTIRRIPRLPFRAPDASLQLTLPNSSGYLDRLLRNPAPRPSGISSLDLPQPLDGAIQRAQDFTDAIFRLNVVEEGIFRDEQLHQRSPCGGDKNRCIELAEQIDEVFTSVGPKYDSDPEQMSTMILGLFSVWIRLDECAIHLCPLLNDYRPAFSPELLNVLQIPTMSDMSRLRDIQRYLSQRHSKCKYGTIFDELGKNCLASHYTASNHARDEKESEWRKISEEYDDHTTGISDKICCCSWSNGERDVRGCTKCWHWRVRNRLQIQAHEAFLPDSNPARDVLLFELAIPNYISAYRDATWRILTLAHPSRVTVSSPPKIKLTDCLPLKPFMTAKVYRISLASSVKCFSQTHYRYHSGKIPLSRVLLPLAADFQLYDHASGSWVEDLSMPLTFQHICGVYVPRGLRTTVLPPIQHPPTTVNGPTSYEVQANQNECPSHMSARRWPNIMDTARLLCQLSVQAGPSLGGEVLRTVHVIFREPAFVARLTETLDTRMRSIQANWREAHSMEVLITITLRLFYLTSESARNATLDWTTRLRKELRTATDADVAQRLALYGFCAALLCRRTFATHAEFKQALDGEDLAAWVGASIALQENLVVDLGKLPQHAYHLQPLLESAVKSHPNSIGDGIFRSWSDNVDGATMAFSLWNVLPPPHDRWIVAQMSECRKAFRAPQTIHYNIVEGHLLINDSSAVKEMFGNQHLLTFPSSLWGMSHQLSHRIHKQEVHFGMRDGQVIIRTINRDNHVIEFIPRHVFISPDTFDLPAELRDGCTHWLNFSTKCLEIRRAPVIWVKRAGDWEVNVPWRRASRRNVDLVDPQSDVFGQVAKILQHFERPEKLTVYQPRGNLSVELRHMELSELNAEIDIDQDAGTWYGLDSKVVLRDIISRERSIIVPLGEPQYFRRGMHVAYKRRLLYTKAIYHALTSFPLPDTLTGRTGTEEAFDILRSGAAQPWIPLNDIPYHILGMLGGLAPNRHVTWDENLTITIQHDGYTSLVQNILTKSNRFEFEEVTHLRHRGELQRRAVPDMAYQSRDRRTSSKATRVYEVVRLLVTGCSSLKLETTVESFLESHEVIGGFCDEPSSLYNREPLISQIEDPINEKWGSLVQLCRYADHITPLFFRLGLLAFRPNPDMDTIRSLVAFSVLKGLKTLSPPLYSGFMDFKTRGRPPVELLCALVAPSYRDFEPKLRRGRELKDQYGHSSRQHQALCEKENQEFASHVLGQWPVPADELSFDALHIGILDISLALEKIRPEWERRRKNGELETYANKVQTVLHSHRGTQNASALWKWTNAEPLFTKPKHLEASQTTAGDVLMKVGPRLESLMPNISFNVGDVAKDRVTEPVQASHTSETTQLRNILNKFATSKTLRRQQYASYLLQSLAVFGVAELSNTDGSMPSLEEVDDARDSGYRIAGRYFEEISSALTSGDHGSKWLRLGALWPFVSPLEVLVLLRTSSTYRYGAGMKEALVQYGLAVTCLQRLERIRHALLRRDNRVLREELRNSGHENWSPVQQPDWLLLEVDGNFLIRTEQVDVARAMIAPSSGQNSVLQMNMGKGKTSCIVPMAICVLADGQDLVRLVVPKALLMQTAQMTQSRLGGLVGREVFHVPFSRKTRSTSNMLELYAQIHREARSRRGLILTSYEHVLFFKLGGWQHLADGKIEAAKTMTNFQRWLDDHCRDILDECDFTLAVKTQLNYPSGPEMAVDGYPFRWQVAEELLALVAHLVPELRKKFSVGIEVLERPGSYPIVHLLNSDVEEAVHNHILDSICNGRTSFLRPADSSFPRQQDNIRHILSAKEFDEQKFAEATNAFANSQVASKILLLVRGLLLNRILLLCLNKRWNVQYGLHPNRHPVAVPFEAKGTPSEQSEFGHPDVAILFTCLAFYYTGLNLKQFSQGIQHVLQSDDPAAQYDMWISSCSSLPESLRQWNVINIEDAGQMEELCRHLRLNCNVINHYLNHFVFPIHAKQFEIKLQASAWDLPFYSKGQQRGARTTGFSGTNDNRAMLPLTIRQDDLPSLQQTSAEVLSYLLQPRNRSYQMTVDSTGKRLAEDGLLQYLRDNNIRVLIDAGAYILEMDNAMLAREWMKIDHEAKAAVYFGSDNRAWVHYRGEKKEVPLLATPFADDLNECLVYLDEAHTRGVDLKLPMGAHGALTLALKQTKDFTMQAAMRLRQLGTTQSLTFFAPPEVDRSIRDFCRPPPNTPIDSSHVVSWLLEQTCCVNEDLQSLYVAQGIDFCRRADAIYRYPNFLASTKIRAKLLDVLQQPERQTLEQLYGGDSTTFRTGPMDNLSAPQLQLFVNQLKLHGGEAGIVRMGALEEVEQEREVQVQVEQVRQVQKPTKYVALPFPGLHPIISQFAVTGVLPRAPSTREEAGFEHMFTYMARTTVGRRFGIRGTGSRLFVSTEFGRTIRHGKDNASDSDNSLRPVEWILWSPSTQTALVIIPEEAELLIPKLRLATLRPRVYLIAYAAPVTKAMLCFNTLRYYSLPTLPPRHEFPEWFRFELGVLGGRLYVDSAEWDLLARHLQSPSKENAISQFASANGIIPISFADNPTSFLLEWLMLLRRTQDVIQTPMGYICTGRTLREDHPFRESS